MTVVAVQDVGSVLGRRRVLLARLALFPRLVVVGAGLAVVTGVVWGFVRGLDYLPTLPVAVVEGALLVGIPGTVAATALAAIVTGSRGICRVTSRRRGWPGPDSSDTPRSDKR